MAEQHSISSAVFGLQETLRDLQQKLPCLSNTSTQKQSNELHALGTVNLDKVRQEFTQHVNSIRNICSQFETEVLGDVMKMGAGADPAFRKHFTHLKEQATLESTVMRVKDTLKHTKAFFEDSIKEKEESRSKIETQRLEKIAQSMGLVTFIDSSQKIESGASITTITLGGTVIVIDIDIDDTGRVLKAKVTYVSETLQNDQDDRVDTMFAESLQSRQYDLFKRNLASLALLDQLNVKYSSVDFFLIMKNLFHDLKTIYSQEIAMVSDESRVLLEGHGMPMQHLDYPGVSVAYWTDKETIKSNTLENRNTSRLLLSFEDSVQPMYYLPPSQSSYLAGYEEAIGEHFKAVTETMTPSFMSPFRFIQPLSTHPEVQAVPIRFVATLDSPLAVSDQVCQKLMTVAGLSNGELVSDVSLDTCTLSLEEMLLKDGHDKNKLTQNNWVTTCENAPHQVYKLASSSFTSAKIVSRIPFHHPVQIYNIIQCLRQQQMFNTLFTSIFHSTTVNKESVAQEKPMMLSLKDILSASQHDNTLRLEIITVDAPHSMHITLSPPPLPDQPLVMVALSIDIPADCPTKPIVRLNTPSTPYAQKWNPRLFDQDQMSAELQQTHSIPQWIHWLYNKMTTADSYPMKRSHDFNEDSYPSKAIKMEIDE